MPFSMEQPKSVVHLKPSSGHEYIWAMETPEQVVQAKSSVPLLTDMVELTMWQAGNARPFYTQAGNILSVEDYK